MIKKILKISFLVLAGTILLYLFSLPYVPKLRKKNPETTALIEIRKKQALKKGKGFEPKMVWKNISEISPNMVHAVVLAEDDVFYRHHGFDFDQIKIAIRINWKKKRFAYGGSTLTQQLARTLYLSPSKNILRKLKEAMITLWMEWALPKKRILELYLNVVEWGDGIFGAEAASRIYYHKSAHDLSPEESVALVSILPSPRKWSPLRETPFMVYRRSNILSRMKGGESESKTAEKERETILQNLPEMHEDEEDEENGFEIQASSPDSRETKSEPVEKSSSTFLPLKP